MDCRFTVTNWSCILAPPLSTAIIDGTSSSHFTLFLDNVGHISSYVVWWTKAIAP